MTRASSRGVRRCGLAVVAALAGCSQIGARTTRGAVTEARTAIKGSGGALPEALARSTMTGAIQSLSEPEQQDRLDLVIGSASEAAARGFAAGIRREAPSLGLLVIDTADRVVELATARLSRTIDDSGLRGALASVSRELGKSVVADVCDHLGTVFPDCGDISCGRCIEAHITSVSRAAARGVSEEMAGTLRLPVLVMTFGAGAMFALLLATVRRLKKS